MRFPAAHACSCMQVVFSCVSLPPVRAEDKPDPVHHRDVKREARRQQREQAKRMARARKGVKP
jgi:hypothetical protein